MKRILSILIATLLVIMPIIFAADEGDIFIGGFELEKVLNLASAILAIAMCILTFIAYRRNGSKRLLYVATAFFFFAVKGILISMELLFGDWSWVDPVASALDFVILLSFFAGILRK